MSDGSVPREPVRWGDAAVSAAVAGTLAVLFLPTGLSAISEGGLAPGWRWVLTVDLVLLHALLLPPLATRHVVVAFATGSASMLLLVTAPPLAGELGLAAAGAPVSPILLPTSLCWFVLLYGVSARGGDPWPRLALAVGLAGCLLAVVRLWDAAETSPAGGGEVGWRLLIVVAVVGGTFAAWALGRYRAARTAWAAAVAERAAADERRRIAREMHDVVAHSLAVVVGHAEGGRMALAQQPERATEVLDTIATTGREALEEMRGLLGVLRDEPATRDGATTAPQQTLDDLPALIDRVRSAGPDVTLRTHGTPTHLSPARQLVGYRFVQESLTNVVKHAGAGATAHVQVDWADALVLTVTDDGGSPGQARGPGASGRGLVGTRERLAAVGGELEVGPTSTGGWRIRARIPT